MGSDSATDTSEVSGKVAPRPTASPVGSSSAWGMFMSYGIAVHTADADFIVGSILSGAAPWLSLSSETTLEYALFGDDSPFANWVGNEPREWELLPTPESQFLTHDLGERVRTWVREFARCAHVDCCGLPAVGGSTFVDTALEGLRLADLIRSELPYYYVEATFFDSVPQAVIDRLDAEVPDRSRFRKIYGKRDVIDRQAMPFQPFGSSQMPPELSTMSAAIMANVDRYGGRVVDPAADVWGDLDAWQARYNENFLGLPDQRGHTRRWRPGFDRLGWMAEGLALQQESHTALEGVHLACGAAYLAVSKDEWDSMLAVYLENNSPGPGHAGPSTVEGAP